MREFTLNKVATRARINVCSAVLSAAFFCFCTCVEMMSNDNTA